MKFVITTSTLFLIIKVSLLGTFLPKPNEFEPKQYTQVFQVSILNVQIASLKSHLNQYNHTQSWFSISYRDSITSLLMNRQGALSKPYSGLGPKLRPGLIHGGSKRLVLSYLCILLITNAHDTQINPGPRKPKFPCQICTKAVKWGQHGVRCDCCQCWYHAECMTMGMQTYDFLSNNSSVMWICTTCGLPNYSSGAIFPGSPVELTNSFSSLRSTESGDSLLTSPIASSSPIDKPDPIPTVQNKKLTLRSLVINCQGIRSKKASFAACVENQNPDIVIGTESWLDGSVSNTEIFPHNFTVFRKDREETRTQTGGGGVFIAIRNDIVATHAIEYDTDCEILWVQIKLVRGKNIIIGAFYRTPSQNDAEY
jgi:hypothetical protein